MNRKKYITLTLMLSLLFMNKTYAACTQEEIRELRHLLIDNDFLSCQDYKKKVIAISVMIQLM